MLEEVRKFGLELPQPTKEEQETFDKMKELNEYIKDIQQDAGSDTGDLASARLESGSTMTDGTLESTMEVARIPIDAEQAVIKCSLDDPNPPEFCDSIDWGFA